MSRVRTLIVGLGAIGMRALVEAIKDPQLEPTAAVDPKQSGMEVAGLTVHTDLVDCKEVDADVALVATGSSVEQVYEQVMLAVELGLDVVSTCEELAYPWQRNALLAAELDRHARKYGCTIVGTGVNPGFVMDSLPVVLASACLRPQGLSVTRRANLARRRPQLRDKCGVGMSESRWHAANEDHGMGHRGLVESTLLCAKGLGWEFAGDVVFRREPLIGDDGTVVGIHETAEGCTAEGRKVSLALVFQMGAEDEDVVEVEATTPLRVRLEGGVQGEEATIARFLHAARMVGTMAPGLCLPIEVPGWTST